jgi:hypothetical protein
MPMPQHLTRPSHPRLRRSHRSKAVPALSPHEPPVAPRSPPAPSQPARARHPTLVSALAHPHQIPNPNGIASPTVGLHKRPTLRGVPPVNPNANAVAPQSQRDCVPQPKVGLHKRPTLRGIPPVTPNTNAVAPTNPNGIASPSPGLACTKDLPWVPRPIKSLVPHHDNSVYLPHQSR